MSRYSIIIPVHNEIRYIPSLLNSLEFYIHKGHQIIIIDDGSDDGSTNILQSHKRIHLILTNENKGKGHAIRRGLSEATNDKVIIYDGDMELNPLDIINLMFMLLCLNLVNN